MKFEAIDIFNCKYTSRNIPRGALLLPFTLLLLVVLFPLIRNLNQSSSKIYASSSLGTTEVRRCNISSGKWVPSPRGPSYNNETCPFIMDKVSCMSSGRPGREFLYWRWKPDECELPLFDASQFLNLVRGRSLAFVGDSMGRNQMESLLCLLNTVVPIEDITARYGSNDNIYFRWWFSAGYNFTLATLWSPFLVKSNNAYLSGNAFYNAENIYLDEADKAWTSQIENFDYVIISAGQWFFRPLVFYENSQVVGCQRCEKNNTNELNFYGYRKAFRTAFRTICNLKGYKGMTFFVTQSPNHFENGEWNKGGSCTRTKPSFTKEEMQVFQHRQNVEAYQTQVEEFTAAEKEFRKRGLRFDLIDISNVMMMRPDGHPSKYGQAVNENVTISDCVHWCVPGPIDTWNEFLLYMLKIEGEKSSSLT